MVEAADCRARPARAIFLAALSWAAGSSLQTAGQVEPGQKSALLSGSTSWLFGRAGLLLRGTSLFEGGLYQLLAQSRTVDAECRVSRVEYRDPGNRTLDPLPLDTRHSTLDPLIMHGTVPQKIGRLVTNLVLHPA